MRGLTTGLLVASLCLLPISARAEMLNEGKFSAKELL